MPPETTLQQLIALLTAHSWLPVIAIVTLYLRKILSPASGFPITVPPRWLPVVSSTGALASGLVSSLQAGEGAGAAILDMAIMAAGGGFLDGLVTAIFDHDNAPAWARALVFVFDDLGGGSGGKRAAGGPAFGHPKSITPYSPAIAQAAKQPPPPAAARRRNTRPGLREWAIGLGFCALMFPPVAAASLMIACGSAQQTATDVTIGINATGCVITNAAADIAAGMTPPQIVVDLVKKCGVTVAQIATIFDNETKAAEQGITPAHARLLAAAARASDGGL
jgi:hypothetical protein